MRPFILKEFLASESCRFLMKFLVVSGSVKIVTELYFLIAFPSLWYITAWLMILDIGIVVGSVLFLRVPAVRK